MGVRGEWDVPEAHGCPHWARHAPRKGESLELSRSRHNLGVDHRLLNKLCVLGVGLQCAPVQQTSGPSNARRYPRAGNN